MDWIEKLIFYKEDLLVLGFHTVRESCCCLVPVDNSYQCFALDFYPSKMNMVLHSTAQNKHIMEVNCGGGHRSYGVSSFNEVSVSNDFQCTVISSYIVQYTL